MQFLIFSWNFLLDFKIHVFFHIIVVASVNTFEDELVVRVVFHTGMTHGTTQYWSPRMKLWKFMGAIIGSKTLNIIARAQHLPESS